ncbi:uncharacterized protein EURHEDRAFT_412636 [Aspergillus ruber CBS 135680]|uniref:Uncharacterized protein n=1 Tax=Aspergillus ruber (strain CBS 135680) TaxID=1388766 RepID=A0A017SCP2_ASPRC|nr:uncharacterized protein EURHEDRAFT_412636 [Aspergillus ruber CBS 135680]EYE94818.1 hypothetical protein EURHEDRAFT_412636 [Aspergillus ruber CBS 135680]
MSDTSTYLSASEMQANDSQAQIRIINALFYAGIDYALSILVYEKSYNAQQSTQR